MYILNRHMKDEHGFSAEHIQDVFRGKGNEHLISLFGPHRFGDSKRMLDFDTSAQPPTNNKGQT